VLVLAMGVPTFSSACDSSSNLVDDDGGVGGGPDADPLAPDADPFAPDADPFAPDAAGCNLSAPQCSNGCDDDGDGQVDGFDPECSGGADDDESSFATGISGDNVDAKTQDCFFDGNSGGGDDKCAYHTCCLTDVAHDGTCPANLEPPNYDETECGVSAECIANCAPLTPPGCDCFGCCTVCDSDSCRDIAISPAVSPACTLETLDDPAKCFACVKSTECGGETCGPETCVLCPGQLPEDLPDSCNETPACPGSTVCSDSSDCASGDYCASGCCIHQIG
jgi:hypothetical protein